MRKPLGVLFQELRDIYAQMPETVGCVSCGKCCKVQHPHCYNIEFFYILDALQKWSEEEIGDLQLACISHYISNDMNKPCVFLDEKNRCKIYEHRDYNCRAFGIIPKKVYAKRVKEVKKKFPGVRLGLEKQSDCCGDVHPETFIGGKKLDQLFEAIRDLDRQMGIPEEEIHEANNYMTFHDHYLLYCYQNNQEFLQRLTNIKYNCDEAEKKRFVEDLRIALKKEVSDE